MGYGAVNPPFVLGMATRIRVGSGTGDPLKPCMCLPLFLAGLQALSRARLEGMNGSLLATLNPNVKLRVLVQPPPNITTSSRVQVGPAWQSFPLML